MNLLFGFVFFEAGSHFVAQAELTGKSICLCLLNAEFHMNFDIFYFHQICHWYF